MEFIKKLWEKYFGPKPLAEASLNLYEQLHGYSPEDVMRFRELVRKDRESHREERAFDDLWE
jgi:hypothetical protein